MRMVLLKMMLVSIASAGAMIAQNSDFGLLYGVTVCGDCPTSNVASGNQLNYARQVLTTGPGDLYVEFPLVMISNPVSNVDYLFTPGLRFKVTTRSRASLYGALGVGVASFGGRVLASRTTSGAVDFAGGLDFRLTRLLSLRVEARDFVSRPGLGGITGRNHVVYSIGIGFHF